MSNYTVTVADVAKKYLGVPLEDKSDRLYFGNGAGAFVDRAGSANLRQPSAPMGSNFGDVNNDGFLDFYLGTGNFPYESIMPNLMYIAGSPSV